MNTQTLIIPATIIRGPGALDSLGKVCSTLGRRALVIGGHRARAAVREQLEAQLAEHGITVVGDEWFGGDTTRTQIDRLKALASTQDADVLIGVGGGKALDTVKATAAEAGLPLITIPTIAATCAAITPLTVTYTEEGLFLDLYNLPKAPDAVIIDSQLLATAPLRWLAAGLGDTLAKWYEFRALGKSEEATAIAASSVASSRICYDMIRLYGGEACAGVREQRDTPALEQVLDAIFTFAGLTSIMASGAHACAAHGIYAGFTACDKTRHYGHGLLVGFGNLCLLALEGRSDDEIIEAIQIARDCSVPLTLDEIEPTLTAEELDTIIAAALTSHDMGHMPFEVTAADLKSAFKRVDALVATQYCD